MTAFHKIKVGTSNTMFHCHLYPEVATEQDVLLLERIVQYYNQIVQDYNCDTE